MLRQRQQALSAELQAIADQTNDRAAFLRLAETLSAFLARLRSAAETLSVIPEIERDAKGFVRTGTALAQSRSWRIARPPFLLETSRPGVFAAGDVRSGSVKRVASAVGEGAMAVQFVHEYLKEM